MIYYKNNSLERKYNMNNDKLLSSLSQHIAYWYVCVKGEKDIIFPVNNTTKEDANKIFRNRYQHADVIISEKGEIYKISKEVCCESDKWSYVYYLDDMKKNYRLKKICKDLLPYPLYADNIQKITAISNLKIPGKIITISAKQNEINNIIKSISPYLKNLTYINSKEKKIIAYPDVISEKNQTINIFLNYYHHHHMDKHLKKIQKALSKYLHLKITIQNNK